MGWITDLSANRFNNTYFRDAHDTGFAVDMSGDLVVRGNLRINNGIDSIAIGDGASTSTFTNAVAIGNGATASANNQFSLGIGSSVYRFAGLINNLTRRSADGTQINIPENALVNILFQNQSSAGLLDYNAATGVFTNNTGRTLIAMVSVCFTMGIPSGTLGRRAVVINKNGGMIGIDSAEIGSPSLDGNSLSLTFDINNGDTINAQVFYFDFGSVNVGFIATTSTSISILCL
jgi:hypothetical protein